MQQKEVNTRVKNKMPNTEKPTAIAEKKKTNLVGTRLKDGLNKSTQKGLNKGLNDGLSKQKKASSLITPKESASEANQDKKISEPSDESNVKGKKSEKQKEGKKKPDTSKPKIKKDKAIVNGIGFPISAKYSVAICRFIKRKKIETAIEELEEVLKKKRAIPMRGEIPHQKGLKKFASGSGKYPKKATEQFIKILKNLQANANVNGLAEPIITTAIANFASRPFGKFGRWRRKRAHVKIIATEKNIINENKMRKR